MANNIIKPYSFKALPTLDDIKGYDLEKQEIKILIESIKLSLSKKQHNQYRPKGLFLEGRPGTGKTMFAKSLINEMHLPTYLIDGTALLSSMSAAIEHINAIFAAAKKNKYAIIFIDEVSRLVPEQGMSGFKSDTSRSILSCLLTNLDGVESAENIFVIMTSTDSTDLDDALTRPGRVDKIITLHSPNITERETIIKYYVSCDSLLSKENINYKLIAKKTNEFTAASLKALVAETSIVCKQLKDKKESYDITHIFLERILYTMSVNVRGELVNLPQKMKDRLCYHELGHAIIRYLCKDSWSDIAINTAFNDKVATGGMTLLNDDLDDDDNSINSALLDRNGVRDFLCVALAGRVAEFKFCGSATDGCRSDLNVFKQVFLQSLSDGVYGYKYCYINDMMIMGEVALDEDIKKLFTKELNDIHTIVCSLLSIYEDFIRYAKDILLDKMLLSAEDIEQLFNNFYADTKNAKKLEKKKFSEIKTLAEQEEDEEDAEPIEDEEEESEIAFIPDKKLKGKKNGHTKNKKRK